MYLLSKCKFLQDLLGVLAGILVSVAGLFYKPYITLSLDKEDLIQMEF